MGTGGGNVPLVMNAQSSQERIAPKAYGICSKDSNAMKSDNPHSGIYEATTSRTIDGNGGNPSCNQGGIAVVESYAIQGSMIGRGAKNGPQGDGINEDVSFTLNTVDRHAVYAMTTGSFTQVSENTAPTVLARDYKDPTTVCYGIGRDAFNQGKNAKFSPTVMEELQPTLVAKGPGGVAQVDEPQTASEKSIVGTISASMGSKQWLGNQEAFSGDYHIVYPNYTVRRLTPTECARLQGFPDWWCSDLGTDDPSEEDIRYWQEVFETHRKITESSTKPKTVNQIVKWLKDPHSDAAEYKLWGNGVCLSNVWFVLAGIAYYTQSRS